MKNFLTDLRTTAWRTSGARYNAARRLKRRELFSTVSLALFSALSVAITFIQRIYVQPSSPADNYLTALSACLGIFLLTISLMEWGAANGAKAEALHKNAEALNEFQRNIALTIAKLNAQEPIAWPDVENLSSKYEAIKIGCSHNHESIDEQFFRASKRDAPEFKGTDEQSAVTNFENIKIAAFWYLSSIWYFAIFWIIITIGIVVPICIAL